MGKASRIFFFSFFLIIFTISDSFAGKISFFVAEEITEDSAGARGRRDLCVPNSGFFLTELSAVLLDEDPPTLGCTIELE